MQHLIDMLHAGAHSLVVSNGGRVYSYDQRGVADLLRLIDHEPQVLNGAMLADKVVGRGAAMLMVVGRVARVHADVISEPALSVLQREGVAVSYTHLVPNIANRTKTGLCPMEQATLHIDDPQLALQAIRDTLAQLRANINR